MRKPVLSRLFICMISLICMHTAISQTVTNGSFDGTTTGWTQPSGSTCGATAAGEVNNTSPCYGATGTCTNYGSCGSGCAYDYVAEVDHGNSPGICQTISGFTSGASAASTSDLYISFTRRVQGNAPFTVGIIVCLTDPNNSANTTCTTLTANNSTWVGYTTVQWNFATPTITSGTSLILSINPVTSYYDPTLSPSTCTDLSPPPGSKSCNDNYGMIVSYVSFTAPTPVTLLNFTAIKNGSEVDIKWQTETEKNSDYFVIEKSKNGIDFIGIENIKAAGNRQQLLSYETSDPSPYNGTSYYRLKQVDFDGKFSYSKIASVQNDEAEVNIYPNPNQGSFNISVINEKQLYNIEVEDVEGRLIYTSSGNPDNSITEITGLSKGVYVVRVIGENTIVLRKLVVL